MDVAWQGLLASLQSSTKDRLQGLEELLVRINSADKSRWWSHVDSWGVFLAALCMDQLAVQETYYEIINEVIYLCDNIHSDGSGRAPSWTESSWAILWTRLMSF